MAITITVDNDSGTAGIQPLLEDESPNPQLPTGGGDDGNEINVTLISNALGGFQAAFNTYLNGLGLSAAQMQFAADNDGASSSSTFIQVSVTNNETISNLFFSDAQGQPLDGDIVAGMKTLDGLDVSLWSSGDFCLAKASDGRIVAAFYLNEAANHLSAQVQMVTFEPLQHPNMSDPDDQLNFTDVMRVSASGTISFNFDNLNSGSFLWAAVGSSSAGLLVTGQDLDVIDGGNKNGEMVKGGGDPSDSVNTSQGGIGATIGINSQHFADQSGPQGTKLDGPVGVFTLVNGFVPLNNAAQATGIDVDQIDYANYINAPSAKIFISQVTGGTASMRILLYEAGGTGSDLAPGSLKTEEGYADTANSYSYIGDQATDSHLKDDFAVPVASVTVLRGNTLYTFNASGTQAGITVTISGNAITLTGIMTSDTIGFAAVNDPNSAVDGTFNRFDIQALAGTAAFDIGRIDLDQGVSVNSAVGDRLIVEDDGPSIVASPTNAPSITDDESFLLTDNHANYAGNFTTNFGSDGAGATPRSYALSTPGGASGLTDTASGQSVVLVQAGATVEGRTSSSNALVFVISVDQTGEVTLDQRRAVVHTDTSSFDESRGLTGSNLVVLTATAYDGDGDSDSDPLDLTGLLNFKDDGIAIVADPTNAPSITDDESVLGTDNHANYAGNFTVTLGADGAGATPRSYALSTPGGASGLTDTGSGQSVVLVQVGATIEGRTSVSGLTVFVISVDQTGEVTLDQRRAVVHSDTGDPDDSRGLTGSNLVVLTATAFDGDGDSDSDPLDLTGLLNFKDDGPSIVANPAGAPSITDDESFLATDNHANYAGNFTPTFGADGAGATPRSYALSTPGGASGLTDTASGQSVVLVQVGATIEGRTSVGGDTVFVISVDQNGEVTLDQRRAVVHADTNSFDESRGLTGSNLVVLTATAYDGDGDSDSDPLDLTGLLNFKDDGISIVANPTGAPTITDDESVLATNNGANYAGNFTVTLGADGAGATPRSYSLSTPGGDCGLIESGTGLHVFLFKVGDDIVGKSGTNATTAATGTVVFIVSIDQTGQVSLDQQRAVVHNPNVNADDSTTLASAGAIVVNARAFDGDGDHADAALNIGQLVNFVDDAPAITAQILGGTINFVAGASVSHSLNGAVHADINNASEQSLSGVSQYTILNNFSEPTNVYPGLDGVLSAGNTILTYYSDATHTTAVYRLTLDQTDGAAGSYTFEVLAPPPLVQINFDFTDLPSGQNLFGIIAVDKADLSKGGLLVMPNSPDINNPGDGMMTNVSGTVNTSKGGGPVTIGNGNQAFDNLNEGAFFCYVDNPSATAVGGMGLTQVTADDADFIDFIGTNEVTRASVEIVQASGGGTVKRPGPSLQIFAYDIDPGAVNTDPVSRAFLLDPTATDDQSNIIGCKIFDSAGNLVEYRTNLEQGASNFGTLAGGTDAVVSIQFILDFGGATAGDFTDDIYSVLVSNLKAGYTIEFVTEEGHDLALVENRSGSFDIGGFNILNNTNVPAQDFNFQVQISDYDNDTFSSALSQFSVHVNGIIF